MRSSPILDMDFVETLKAIEQESEENANFFSELVSMFISNSKQHLLQMKQYAETRQGGELKKIAHKLKGESANIGCARLAEICQKIQETDDDHVIREVKSLWNELVQTYKSTLAELDEVQKSG